MDCKTVIGERAGKNRTLIYIDLKHACKSYNFLTIYSSMKIF